MNRKGIRLGGRLCREHFETHPFSSFLKSVVPTTFATVCIPMVVMGGGVFICVAIALAVLAAICSALFVTGCSLEIYYCRLFNLKPVSICFFLQVIPFFDKVLPRWAEWYFFATCQAHYDDADRKGLLPVEPPRLRPHRNNTHIHEAAPPPGNVVSRLEPGNDTFSGEALPNSGHLEPADDGLCPLEQGVSHSRLNRLTTFLKSLLHKKVSLGSEADSEKPEQKPTQSTYTSP